MKTIFALFKQYEDARTAVDQLLEDGFEEEKMNAVVLSEVAKNEMDVDLETVAVDVSDEFGRQSVFGLDHILGGEQPVPIVDIGPVYAGGDEATILANTSANAEAVDGGLKAALMTFNIPEEAAEAYRDAVREEGVLFWIHAPDERAAEAAEILRTENGGRVASYASGAR